MLQAYIKSENKRTQALKGNYACYCYVKTDNVIDNVKKAHVLTAH